MMTAMTSPAGYFEVMFTQQVAPYNQDLGVAVTSHMHMNRLLRCEAYLWYFLPPITSVLVLWWYALSSSKSQGWFANLEDEPTVPCKVKGC